MSSLFEKTVIGRLELQNRFVRSATWEGMCEAGGAPTPRLEALYGDLAEGGVGGIVTGYAYVRPEGKQTPGQTGIHEDSLVAPLSRLAQAVHGRGGKVVAQIVHAGGQAMRKSSGLPPVAPSAVPSPQYAEVPRELTQDEIAGIVAAFGAAAARARAAGFDGVQLHGAHGYLINQFLSPATNRRSDGYGGALEGRARFLGETVRAVREAVGPAFPVWIKLNGDDFLEGGFALEDACRVAAMLEGWGIDAIEVSGGTGASGERKPGRLKIDAPGKEAYHRELARAIKARVGVSVGVVGGVRSPEVARQVLEAGDADFFALARPLVREPGLVRRWASGDLSKATCVSCSGCFVAALKEGGIRCVAK